ncbi:tail fiber assembly protein [Enterobacter hormaechei]|uniref:tail fiber assembly protein n=1 Tax=Enterobacter cloacae complex TaxID=354276 RepID=UPI000651859B|nr:MULTISPECIES: tail fiber assembly protein [Enterobacter cloacae complex]EHF4961243.1 tail fiber assembly protein [Enterobacter hormaechei]EHF4975727.1 tail fiber assembly protein [Enterobacter hormaechei]EHF4987918.1 tail fiber assembly protein [Enterobacter hormaechei]EHF5052204.1 tail fiber assembly protein [Enterobacter hormaechei]EKT9357563.1 tail fiber assembly protein [Enterobacter hormaechei]
MAFKFSSKDRTIRIYNLRADTREFIGAGDAYIPANTGLPADCTNIAPPEVPNGKVAVFNGTKWELVEDYRNQKLYSKETGERVYINGLGALPPDVTTIAPDANYMRWNGEGWEKDTEAERAAAVAFAESEKKRLTQEATLIIETLNDAVELSFATEAEVDDLIEWKKYRVLLNRVDTSEAQDIKWPSPPTSN